MSQLYQPLSFLPRATIGASLGPTSRPSTNPGWRCSNHSQNLQVLLLGNVMEQGSNIGIKLVLVLLAWVCLTPVILKNISLGSANKTKLRERHLVAQKTHTLELSACSDLVSLRSPPHFQKPTRLKYYACIILTII